MATKNNLNCEALDLGRSCLDRSGVLLSPFAKHGQFDHFSLKGLDYEHQPDHGHREPDDHRELVAPAAAEDRDDKENHAGQFERNSERNSGAP